MNENLNIFLLKKCSEADDSRFNKSSGTPPNHPLVKSIKEIDSVRDDVPADKEMAVFPQLTKKQMQIERIFQLFDDSDKQQCHPLILMGPYHETLSTGETGIYHGSYLKGKKSGFGKIVNSKGYKIWMLY